MFVAYALNSYGVIIPSLGTSGPYPQQLLFFRRNLKGYRKP